MLTVSNGQSAVARIPSTSFELLLLDLDMPDLSGLAVYKQVKNSLDSRRIKVAGMALRTAQAEVNNAKQLGIREFSV